MLERVVLQRLARDVARDPRAVLPEVLGRLRHTRKAQERMLEKALTLPCDSILATGYRGRLGILAQQSERLAAACAQDTPLATPYLQYLREAVGDGSSFTQLERLVFIHLAQVETNELLTVLIGALDREPEQALLSLIRIEEMTWQEWTNAQLVGRTERGEGLQVRKAREQFRRLYDRARLYAVGTFLQRGLR